MVFCRRSDGARRVVSWGDVLGLEALLSPVQQNPQVVAIDAERSADLVLLTLLEEQPFQQLTLLCRQRREDLAHGCALLVHDDRLFGAGACVANLAAGIVAKRIYARLG